jgi:hypothetical protein
MANTLANYDPQFYAAEALISLKKALTMGFRVFRGFDPSPTQPGSSISIRRPMSFTAASMPTSATDLKPETVTISMNQWKGVTFTLTDKELAYTKERIVDEHIAPAAYAVASAIDSSLTALSAGTPWYVSATSPLAVGDVTDARKILVQNGVPVNDGRLHLMLSPTLESEALKNSAFAQWQGAGAAGADTQLTGSLGQRYGFECFVSPNVVTLTSGTCSDVTGALTADAAIGDSTVAIDSVTSGGTAKAGDYLTIAGDSTRYVITADVTFTGGAGTVSISPQIRKAASTSAVVTLALPQGSGASKENSLAFHRDAFALAMGVLPDMIPGAEVSTVVDSSSGLSVRARRWYDGANAAQYIGLDALWGVKTLNGDLAVRILD